MSMPRQPAPWTAQLQIPVSLLCTLNRFQKAHVQCRLTSSPFMSNLATCGPKPALSMQACFRQLRTSLPKHPPNPDDILTPPCLLQALEKLSHEHPAACLRHGGLLATLSYLDFFQTGVQRVAVATAANMCRCLTSENTEAVSSAVPMLTSLLQYSVGGLQSAGCSPSCRRGVLVLAAASDVYSPAAAGILAPVALLDVHNPAAMMSLVCSCSQYESAAHRMASAL